MQLEIHSTDATRAMLDFAAGLGLEPRLDDSESSVLPLDDPAMFL